MSAARLWPATLILAATLSGCGGQGAPVSSASTGVPIATPPQQAPAIAAIPPLAEGLEYYASDGPRAAGAIAAYNAGASGKGVTAAIIDTGIDPNGIEFAGRISSASRDVSASRGIADENGHGTAVAGILGAAKNDIGMMGMAPGATLLALRADRPGSCAAGDTCRFSSGDVAAAIDRATDAGARVINLSLYLDDPSSAVASAVARASAAGIITVIAAGNDAKATPTALAQLAAQPGARGLVIIAGSDTGSGLSTFSNAAGDFAAYYLATPGSGIQSVGRNGETVYLTGTSASAPQIAGAVALLAEAFPNLTSAQIVALLFDTAHDVGAAGVDRSTGHGQLSLTAAFRPKGQTSLAGSKIAVSEATNAILSSAMGDAGTRAALSTVMVDTLGRAYSLDLGKTLSATAARPVLLASLQESANSYTMALGTRASASFAASRPASADTSLNRLVDRTPAASGELQMRLPGRFVAGFAKNQPSSLGQSAAFAAPFVALRDVAGLPFDTRPETGVALQRSIAGNLLTATAQTGAMQRYGLDQQTPGRGPAYSTLSIAAARALGPVALSAGVTRLAETGSVLGAQFGAAFGAANATTTFTDLSASLPLGRWTLGTRARLGRTATSGATLRSQGYQVLASTADAVIPGDRLWLTLGQPLRVSSGGLTVSLPTSYDDATGLATLARSHLDLAPEGRELDADIAWERPIGAGRFIVNVYGRRQPANDRRAPNDIGAAMRLVSAF